MTLNLGPFYILGSTIEFATTLKKLTFPNYYSKITIRPKYLMEVKTTFFWKFLSVLKPGPAQEYLGPKTKIQNETFNVQHKKINN